VVVVVQSPYDEWLMWSSSTVTSREGMGIEAGTPIGLAKTLKELNNDIGLVVLNPCQLLYSYEEGLAIGASQWNNRPGRSFVHHAREIVDEHNRIPGNETPENHVKFVFEKLIGSENWVGVDAKIDIVGLNQGGSEIVLQYLNINCE
jgi:hypothetical protein